MKNEVSNKEMMDIIKEAQRKAKKRELVTITDKSHLSTEDKFKISLCKYFVQYLNENNLKPIDLHKQTGLEQSRISEILHYKITKFTIDKLFSWLKLLSEHSPKIREHLILLEAMINVPIMSVRETKELTKNIKKISGRSESQIYV